MIMQTLHNPPRRQERLGKKKKRIGLNMCDSRGIDWFRHRHTSNIRNRRDSFQDTPSSPLLLTRMNHSTAQRETGTQAYRSELRIEETGRTDLSKRASDKHNSQRNYHNIYTVASTPWTECYTFLDLRLILFCNICTFKLDSTHYVLPLRRQRVSPRAHRS